MHSVQVLTPFSEQQGMLFPSLSVFLSLFSHRGGSARTDMSAYTHIRVYMYMRCMCDVYAFTHMRIVCRPCALFVDTLHILIYPGVVWAPQVDAAC